MKLDEGRPFTLMLAAIPGAWMLASLTMVASALPVPPWDAQSDDALFVATHALGVVLSMLLFAIALTAPRLHRGTLWVLEVLALVVVPAWGFAANLSLPDGLTWDDSATYRAVAWPGILWVFAAHGLALLAHAVARRRPDPLPVVHEVLVRAGLLVGVLTAGSLASQFGPVALFGAFVPTLALPMLAPHAALLIFGGTLAARLVRHGRLDPASVGWAARYPGVASSAVVAGGIAVVSLANAAFTGKTGLYGGAFGDTVGWGMSVLPHPPVPDNVDGHYLCTVAARGHPWLVRPRRQGVRGGRPIVVNRQLAVANAFEDLLHERWPRFGRLARRVYDRVGLPVSRWIRHPLASDAVFVAMLPAQAVFELALLFLDPGTPESRVARMYAPVRGSQGAGRPGPR